MTVKRNGRVLLLAMLLASVSAVLAYLLITSRPDAAPVIVEPPPPSGEPVLIGARSIAEGTTLTADDIEVAYVAPEAKAPRVLSESAQAIGQVTLVEIPKGEQILASSVGDSALAVASAPDTFARDVPVGKRAVAIAIEETVGVGGFVQPGDRVDVIAAFEMQPVSSASSPLGALEDLGDLGDLNIDEPAFSVVELLLQDVEVLAMGQASEATTAVAPPADPAGATTAAAPDGPAPRPEAASATLLVNPAQAMRLLLAVQANGTFRLLLRAPGDSTITELPPAVIANGEVEVTPDGLIGANLIKEDLVITGARFRQTSIPAGGILEFEATVRNVSSELITAGSGGAGPGHVYHTGQTWQSLGDEVPEGVYSVGVTFENAEPQTYPWRWDLGADLAPGQTATITGGIQVPNVPGVQRWWFGTLLQPGTVLEDGVAPVEITIEPVDSVVVTASEIDLREAPWPNAASVLKVAGGTRADVLDYQDGWFLIRSGTSEGWVPESAVVNAELPEAAAVATPAQTS